MISYRKPITFYLRPLANDQVAIVSDHGLTEIFNKVLLKMGHVVEYFLTHDKD